MEQNTSVNCAQFQGTLFEYSLEDCKSFDNDLQMDAQLRHFKNTWKNKTMKKELIIKDKYYSRISFAGCWQCRAVSCCDRHLCLSSPEGKAACYNNNKVISKSNCFRVS